jgi:hypothetical protein
MIKQEPRDFILNQYNAYYGGRTEAISRGCFNADNWGKVNVSDVVSLYPKILKDGIFPYPDGEYYNKVKEEQIHNFNGICKITMLCPKDLFMPLIPVKTDKLRFPTGLVSGVYDFFSIRKAISIGYEILKIEWGIVYENTFNPFSKMIIDLFKQKQEAEKYSIEYMRAKINMNGFYGKLGFNFSNKEKITHFSQLKTGDGFIPIGNNLFKVLTDENSFIPSYVFPIIPVYVTSQARWYMQQLYKKCGYERVLYTDTDCIFTTRKLPSGDNIGDLKHECSFKELIIVRPKFYGGITTNNETIIKVKGLGRTVNDYEKFKNAIINNKFEYTMTMFRKLRGALKNKSYVNQTYEMLKRMSLEDDKRIWNGKFSLNPELSNPYNITQ